MASRLLPWQRLKQVLRLMVSRPTFDSLAIWKQQPRIQTRNASLSSSRKVVGYTNTKVTDTTLAKQQIVAEGLGAAIANLAHQKLHKLQAQKKRSTGDTDEHATLQDMTVAAFSDFVSNFSFSIWILEDRDHTYTIQALQPSIFHKWYVRWQSSNPWSDDHCLAMFCTVYNRDNIFEYDFAHQLADTLARDGSQYFQYLSAAFNLKHCQNNIQTIRSLQEVRSDMTGLIARSNSQDWRALVLLGLLEQHAGEIGVAMKLFVKAVAPAQKEAMQGLSLQQIEVDRSLASLVDFAKPWTCGLNLIIATRSILEQQEIHHSALTLIRQGMRAEDARAFYLSALPEEMDYVAAQTQTNYDPEANATRAARNEEDVGKPAEWLYNITRAAASGQPDAQVELGEYYWKTPHRCLDDEPPDHLKPTSLDRWPADSSSTPITKVSRFLSALGLGGVLSDRPTMGSPEDAFTTAVLPTHAQQRAQLAYEWIKTAADLHYGLALKPLLELLTTEYLPVDTSVPAKPELRFASRLDYFNAIFQHREMSHNTTGEASQREHTPIRNPVYDMVKAQQYILKTFYAISTWRDWNKYRSSFKPTHGLYTASTPAVLGRFKTQQENTGILDWQEIVPWIRDREVYKLWEHEQDEIEQLEKFVIDLVRKNKWEVREKNGRLLMDLRP